MGLLMELLIWIADKSDDALSPKRGDVLDAHPNGWPWSEAEFNNPDWVLIQTGITQAEADSLLAGDYDLTTKVLKRRRKSFVNVTAANLTKPMPPVVTKVPVNTFRNFFGLKP
jgi:hypothetical protein